MYRKTDDIQVIQLLFKKKEILEVSTSEQGESQDWYTYADQMSTNNQDDFQNPCCVVQFKFHITSNKLS